LLEQQHQLQHKFSTTFQSTFVEDILRENLLSGVSLVPFMISTSLLLLWLLDDDIMQVFTGRSLTK